MAFIDYGVIVRINGEFINKDAELFQVPPEFVDEIVMYNGYEVRVKGDFYAYVGDEDCYVVFYKNYLYVISHGKVRLGVWSSPFISDTFFLSDVGIERFKVSHLDPKIYLKPGLLEYNSESGEYVPSAFHSRRYGTKGRYFKFLSRINHGRGKNTFWIDSVRTNRWIAEWDYHDDHYEVIFGSGIDPDSELWNSPGFKDSCYGFTETEIRVLDSWFE